MQDSAEAIISQFLRTYPYPFTIEALRGFIEESIGKISFAECKEFLTANPYVFELQKGIFLTRAGAFTKKKFSIKPTAEEIKKGMFVIGDRCIPYANPEIVSSSLTFLFEGKRLSKKVSTFDSFSAMQFYMLYGEEYVSQYIASDPANDDMNLVQLDFELPFKVKLTGVSLEPFIKKYNFQFGDRLLCELQDWDSGVFSVEPLILHNHKNQIEAIDVKRQEWFDLLEKMLLQSFELSGPRSSIEEQIATATFAYQDMLSKDYCGSIEEFLKQSKKIDFENYGVESRLWYKGQVVPAVGIWNENAGEPVSLVPEEWFPNFSLIIDIFIKDCLYQQKNDFSDFEDFFKKIPFDRKEKKQARDLVEERKAIILEEYNWFADFVVGAVRHRALNLYRKVTDLLTDVESENSDALTGYPQQELVILMQLYVHLVKIFESVENQVQYVNNESETIMLSLEGMEYNFEDIKPLICAAGLKQQGKGFKVIK